MNPCLRLLVAAALLGSWATGQDLGFEKSRAQDILKGVTQDIEKNFYDSKLKGIDWHARTEKTTQQIKAAHSISDIYMAITAQVEDLQDSHTRFIPPGRTRLIRYGFAAKPIGDSIFVYKVKKGGTAEKAGLRLGDQILGVNRFAVEREFFARLMMLVTYLQPAERLDVMIRREGESPRTISIAGDVQEFKPYVDLTVRREFDFSELVKEEFEAEFGAFRKPDANGIAYLRLSTFSGDEGRVERFVDNVAGAKGMILDLRDNGGGYLEALRRFAGRFETEPVAMVDVMYRDKTEAVKVKPFKPFQGLLVVLVDSGSASAAELMTRHLQIRKRATIIGDKTAGLVNASRTFFEKVGVGTAVAYSTQITVGGILFPDGSILEGRGVAPDLTCLPSAADLQQEKDTCYNMARALLRKELGVDATKDLESQLEKIKR
jgi:C-terminal processing protease CtpA/Prc